MHASPQPEPTRHDTSSTPDCTTVLEQLTKVIQHSPAFLETLDAIQHNEAFERRMQPVIDRPRDFYDEDGLRQYAQESAQTRHGTNAPPRMDREDRATHVTATRHHTALNFADLDSEFRLAFLEDVAVDSDVRYTFMLKCINEELDRH